MKKFDARKLIIPVLLLLLIATPVVAQAGTFFEALAGILGRDFGETYDKYWWMIDLIVYTFFFGFIGKMALAKQFDNKGGTLGVVFGIIMAIALVFFESQSDFRLGSLGPFAMGLLFLTVSIVTWNFLVGLGLKKSTAMAFAFVLLYGLLITVGKVLFDWIYKSDSDLLKFFGSGIYIVLFISLIAVFWNTFGFIRKLFGGGGLKGVFKEAGDAKQKEGKEEAEEQAEGTKEEKEERRIQALLSRVEALEKQNYQHVDEMVKDIDEVLKLIKSGRRDPQVIDAIRQQLGHISLSQREIQAIREALQATLAQLAQVVNMESHDATAALQNSYQLAKQEIMRERRTRNWTNPMDRKLTAAQKNIEAQISNLVQQQTQQTRQLGSHVSAISQLETNLPNMFSEVQGYLQQPGRIQSAISTLERIKGLLGQIKAAVQALEKVDVGRFKNTTVRVFRDLKIERELADRLKRDFNNTP